MLVLRLLMAGAIALFALVATLFAAALVFVTGLAALVIQQFRGKRPPVRTTRPSPGPATMRPDGAIDIVATKVPDKHEVR